MVYLWILFYLIGFGLAWVLLGSDFFRYQYEVNVKWKGKFFGSLLSWFLVGLILFELWGCASLYYERNNEFFNYQGRNEKDLYCDCGKKEVLEKQTSLKKKKQSKTAKNDKRKKQTSR